MVGDNFLSILLCLAVLDFELTDVLQESSSEQEKVYNNLDEASEYKI